MSSNRAAIASPEAEPQPSHPGAELDLWRLVRQLLAVIGLAGIVSAELLHSGTAQNVLGVTAVAAFGLAAVMFWWESARSSTPVPGTSSGVLSGSTAHAWRTTLVGLGAFGVAVTQLWFLGGATIARGDVTPPVGTAWISRLFESFAWSGNNLGAAAPGPLALPWGAVAELVHLFGGSTALADRFFISLLVAGALVAAGALFRALGFSPLAGGIGAFIYFFNPYTLTTVGFNTVFLDAMVLVPLCCAVILAWANATWRWWQAIAVFALSAPLLGYAYENPPLIGMVIAASIGAVCLSFLRWGGAAAKRAAGMFVVGGLVALAASAYWIIPAKAAISTVATHRLSSLSSWDFTQVRATLTNNFWLNAIWAWRYPTYFPFAPGFSHLPLELVRAALPALAFGVLARRRLPARWMTRVAAGVAVAALLLLLFATGTRQPGAVIFDFFYSLPYGWLFQTPGRFLLLGGLAYGLLACALVDSSKARRQPDDVIAKEPARGAGRDSLSRSLVAVVCLLVAGSSAYPLMTGSVVPGAIKPFPSQHVTVPKYWLSTFSYLNRQHDQSPLLVLPPDDFYQMPYRWYYGTDGFIVNALRRHVVVPNAQEYTSASAELMSAVRLEARALLRRQFTLAYRTLVALGTPDVLVRGDIVSGFPGRDIVPPAALFHALAEDPAMIMMWHSGPLAVYGTRNPFPTHLSGFATINNNTPNLNALTLVRAGRALVSSSPVPGHESIIQLPGLGSWHLSGQRLTVSETLPADWTYHAVALGSHGVYPPRESHMLVRWRPRAHQVGLAARLGRSLISDGQFLGGPWQAQVGNCNDVAPVGPHGLVARVVRQAGPGRSPALELIARADAACEAQKLRWTRGPLLLSMEVRSLEGANVKVCLWEIPENQCAPMSQPSAGRSWHRYARVVAAPARTKEILLFLYADYQGGSKSVDEYARVVARALPAIPTVMLVGRPKHPSGGLRLTATSTGYSTAWHAEGRHVRVDGLRNGWLARRRMPVASATFTPAVNELRDEIGLALVAAAAAAAASWLVLGGRRHRRARRWHLRATEPSSR